MFDILIGILAVAIVVGTFAVLVLAAWDTRDDYASMHARLARRDARRAGRPARQRARSAELADASRRA